MSGGGKGGSQTTRVQLPAFIEDAAERAVARGEQIGEIGFVPQMGPSVAAFTPAQEAAFAGTQGAAGAFGLPQAQGTGLPQAQDFGGIQAFSSFPLFEQQVEALRQARPGQVSAIESFFIDPVTGAPAERSFNPENNLGVPVTAPQAAILDGGPDGREPIRQSVEGGGGFTSFADMFDGGGPGAAGDQFQGGGIVSDIANARAERREREGRSGGLLGGLL